jgi:hypothetical protein
MLRVSNHRASMPIIHRDAAPRPRLSTLRILACLRALLEDEDQRNFPRAATGNVPTISSPRTITTSSIMLTTTQT